MSKRIQLRASLLAGMTGELVLCCVGTTAKAQTVLAVTQFSYDDQGRPLCTAVRMNPATFGTLPIDACSPVSTPGVYGTDRITKNEYDVAGQLVQIRRAVGTSIEQAYVTYSYTPTGKQKYVIDANGNRATFTYDGYDRQSGWYFPSPNAPSGYNPANQAAALTAAGTASTTDYEVYQYDANGNRTSFRKRDGRTFGYTYDPLNRVTVKTVPDACVSGYACTNVAASATRDVYYSYDLHGLQTAARFDSASGADAVTSTYDGLGRQTSSTTNMGGVSRTLSYQYDANGNRIQVTHPDSTYFTYDYDGLDRPIAAKENGSTAVVTMSWDAQGRRSGEGRGGVATTYGYDAISRLNSLADDLAGTAEDVTTTFGYNPANQITSKARSNVNYAFPGYVNVNRSYAANGLNQYATVGGTAFGYDSNGNLTSDGSIAYTYDAENRLVVTSAGANLTYDPLGRLYQVSKPTTGTTQFLYDGDQLTAEYDGSGTMLRRYVHGSGDDDPLLWYEGAGLADRRSLQIDNQGSIVSVADASGAKLAINAYDEYGIPDGGNMGRFQYTGQAWIPELGMYHYKARIYSPTLGRFLQTDPIGYQDQVNLYAYVANDPVNNADPSGETTYNCTATITTASDGSRTGTVQCTPQDDGSKYSQTFNLKVTTYKETSDGLQKTGEKSYNYSSPWFMNALPGAHQRGMDQFLGGVFKFGYGLDLGGTEQFDPTSAMAGGSLRNLGNLSPRAGERAADVARSRGATGANMREMGPWADKPLGEVARAAAQGDQGAAKALKIVKQAGRLGQKY